MKNYFRASLLLDTHPIVAASVEASMNIDLPNWSIVGGLIRDLAWGSVFGRNVPPRDIDLIYFNKNDANAETDWEIEDYLRKRSGLPFRVNNQARMHEFNDEEEYSGIVDAMSKFPTTVSAIGISGSSNGTPVMFSIFGYEPLFSPVFQMTPHFFKSSRGKEFSNYLDRNGLLKRWPEVPVRTGIDSFSS